MKRKFFSYRPAFRKPYSNPFSIKPAGPLSEFACPETGDTINCSSCFGCRQYGVWREDDSMRCVHEYRELEKDGFYAETQEEWEEHLLEIDPGKYGPVVEQRRENEREFKEMMANQNKNNDGAADEEKENAENESSVKKENQGNIDDMNENELDDDEEIPADDEDDQDEENGEDDI